MEEPTLAVTAIAGWVRTFLWIINKTASPTVLNLSPGESGTVQETVSVINDAGVTEAFVEGYVCITNTYSEEVKKISCTLELIIPSSQTPVISIPLDINAHPILQAKEVYHYPYRITIPSLAFIPGESFIVTVRATITNSFECLETEPLPQKQKPLQSVPLQEDYSRPKLNSSKGGPSFVKINCTKTISGVEIYKIIPNRVSKHRRTPPYCLCESAYGTFPSKETLLNQTISVPGPESQSFNFTALQPPKVQAHSYTMHYTCNQTSPCTIVCNIYKLLISTRGAERLMVDVFPQQSLSQQGQAGTTLTETITGTAYWVKTYNWVLAKTANPNVLDLFRGDTAPVNYTITATTSNLTTEAYIEGVVNICNGGAVATVGLQSMLLLTMPPSQTVIASVPLDISSYPVIPAGECHPYPYRITIPNFQPGAQYKVTADTTILNHSGHLGEPFGPNESVSVFAPTTFTDFVNQTIHVQDTNLVNGVPFSTTFTATETPTPQFASYTVDYSCGRDEPPFANPTTTIYNNTATILETGQTASTTVKVNCYDLLVTKTAQTSFTRTWNWSITKTAFIPDTSTQITSLILAPNETYTVEYRIMVNPSSVDNNFRVTGTITVTNPNPTQDASILTVRDLILPPDNIIVTVTPSTAIIPPGKSTTFEYSAELPNYASRTDQAIVTLQNSSNGTTDFESAKVTFGFDLQNPTIEVDPCVNVFDSYPNPNTPLTTNPLCRSGRTFSYTRDIGPYLQCSNIDFSIDNTAIFTSTSSSLSGSATSMLSVSVPCSTGCTLTIGYWKTHAGIGPRPNWPDVVTPLLPISLGQAVITSSAQAYAILNFQGWYTTATPPGPGAADASNGINKLYAQLLAAKLNIKQGASASPVASTITSADGFLLTHDSSSWATLTRAQKNQVLSWMTTLEQYNSGLLGVPHCSEPATNGTNQLIVVELTDSNPSDASTDFEMF